MQKDPSLSQKILTVHKLLLKGPKSNSCDSPYPNLNTAKEWGGKETKSLASNASD